MYAKGYRRDSAERRANQHNAGGDLRKLAGIARIRGGIAKAVSHEAHEHSILDQNRCGSCTGHGTAQALFTAFGIDGAPLDFCPSPFGIYANARALEQSRLGVAATTLEDSGAMPADVVASINQFGIRAMRAPSPLGFNTDVDTSNVADVPALIDLEEEALHIACGEFRIDETSFDFIEQICTALAVGGAKGLGAPVGIGAFVDTAFENYDPSQGPVNDVNLSDANGGGHWICITGYRTEADGTVVFRGPNSWGESWGDAGHFEVTENWIKKAVWDCYPFLAVWQKEAA